MRLLTLLGALIDVRFPSILAGHGYDLGNSSGREPRGDDESGGISTMWILAVVGLALFTAAILVSLNPAAAKARLRGLGPKALILVVMAVPLIAWTATSSGGGDDEDPSLMAERWVGLRGAPELLISLGEDDLNTLQMTGGKRTVRVECVGREGDVVLEAEQRWPFVDEAGYDYPHAHQPASRDQLQRAERCALRGTRERLEGDVEGALPR